MPITLVLDTALVETGDSLPVIIDGILITLSEEMGFLSVPVTMDVEGVAVTVVLLVCLSGNWPVMAVGDPGTSAEEKLDFEGEKTVLVLRVENSETFGAAEVVKTAVTGNKMVENLVLSIVKPNCHSDTRVVSLPSDMGLGDVVIFSLSAEDVCKNVGVFEVDGRK